MGKYRKHESEFKLSYIKENELITVIIKSVGFISQIQSIQHKIIQVDDLFHIKKGLSLRDRLSIKYKPEFDYYFCSERFEMDILN